MKGAFATRMSGSADLYHNHDRRPFHSINFVTAHDGFSLYDMVSYNGKHNQVRLTEHSCDSTISSLCQLRSSPATQCKTAAQRKSSSCQPRSTSQ